MLGSVMHPMRAFRSIMCVAVNVADTLHSLGDLRSQTMHSAMEFVEDGGY